MVFLGNKGINGGLCKNKQALVPALDVVVKNTNEKNLFMKEQKVKKILEKFNDHRRIRTVLKLFKAEHLSEEEALEMILTDEQFHRQPEQPYTPYYPITYPTTTPYYGSGTITYVGGSGITTTNVGSSSDNTT